MENFTARETQVMELLREGYSNPEISEALIISIHTTKAFISSIYRKLNVTNRVQAVIKYTQLKDIESLEK